MAVDWLKWVFASELQFHNFWARQYLNDQEGQEETLWKTHKSSYEWVTDINYI